MAYPRWPRLLERLNRLGYRKPEPLNQVGAHKETGTVEAVVAVAGDGACVVVAPRLADRVHQLDEPGDLVEGGRDLRDRWIYIYESAAVRERDASRDIHLWYLTPAPKLSGSYGGCS